MCPSEVIICSECGRKIRGYTLSDRMNKLHMHKRLRHPTKRKPQRTRKKVR